MIRLWISRRASVPIREQLNAQLTLGILSRKLRPGERLPSVRDLARRLRIHPNTVSAVYHDLSLRGWVQTRHGSGVFVNESVHRAGERGLTTFVREWVNAASARGFSLDAILAELQRLQQSNADTSDLIVVDPDVEFARILANEITEAVGRYIGCAGCEPVTIANASQVFVNAGSVGQLAGLLDGRSFHTVHIRSMQDVVAGQTRPAGPVLIGVVSRSKSVLSWAPTLLSALGFDSESLVLRNPADSDWQHGLSTCDVLACDVCAAKELPDNLRPITFRLVTEDSLAEVRSLVTA